MLVLLRRAARGRELLRPQALERSVGDRRDGERSETARAALLGVLDVQLRELPVERRREVPAAPRDRQTGSLQQQVVARRVAELRGDGAVAEENAERALDAR